MQKGGFPKLLVVKKKTCFVEGCVASMKHTMQAENKGYNQNPTKRKPALNENEIRMQLTQVLLLLLELLQLSSSAAAPGVTTAFTVVKTIAAAEAAAGAPAAAPVHGIPISLLFHFSFFAV